MDKVWKLIITVVLTGASASVILGLSTEITGILWAMAITVGGIYMFVSQRKAAVTSFLSDMLVSHAFMLMLAIFVSFSNSLKMKSHETAIGVIVLLCLMKAYHGFKAKRDKGNML